MSRLLPALISLSFLIGSSWAQDLVPSEPSYKWWKGNIHTHSLWSDGNDFPEMIAEWYRTRGYNFLALSDHNILSQGKRWMSLATIQKRGGDDVMRKYQSRFGGGWVESRETEKGTEIRLKPLDEFRALVEERGRFLLIQGEEITDSVKGKPVHMNATNLRDLIQPLSGDSVVAAIEANLRAVQEQGRKEGREVLVHLNHPNFHYAITAEEIANVISERHFEVYNGHPGVNHLGDDNHPSIEQMWDIANTIRLGQLDAPTLYGVATDDSHVYHGQKGSRPGRGWIMVRSRYLTPEHIVRAVNAGDFYCSSGVTLERIEFDQQSGKLSLQIAAEPGVSYTTRFVGTLKNYDRVSRPRLDSEGNAKNATRIYSADVGKELQVSDELSPTYSFKGDELFVRAVVTSNQAHSDPSFKEQKTQAWTQPFSLISTK